MASLTLAALTRRRCRDRLFKGLEFHRRRLDRVSSRIRSIQAFDTGARTRSAAAHQLHPFPSSRRKHATSSAIDKLRRSAGKPSRRPLQRRPLRVSFRCRG